MIILLKIYHRIKILIFKNPFIMPGTRHFSDNTYQYKLLTGKNTQGGAYEKKQIKNKKSTNLNCKWCINQTSPEVKKQKIEIQHINNALKETKKNYRKINQAIIFLKDLPDNSPVIILDPKRILANQDPGREEKSREDS